MNPMVRCPYCGIGCKKGAKFCTSCGQSLGGTDMAGDDTRIGKAMVRCPICGEDFELGTPVCINCGTVLSKVDGDRILAFGDVTLPKDYKGNVSSTGRIVIRDDQISSR